MDALDFYTEFEKRYRGSRQLIKSRLLVYESFLRPFLLSEEQPQLLDLGCGRGEWLELTTAWGFVGLGVDLSDGMLAACHELNLNVKLNDALTSLLEAENESLHVVSAFHLVEHIPFDDVRTLIQEAYRVLKPGGLLILETPNPENLIVGATTFYLDPSHLRPIPPALLSFATEFAGFLRNKIVRLQGLKHESQASSLESVLQGVSADYSIIAQKPGQTGFSAGFDAAFKENFGTSLQSLLASYDQSLEERLAPSEWVHARIRDADIRVDHAQQRAFDAEMRILQIAAQLEQATSKFNLADSLRKETEDKASKLKEQLTNAYHALDESHALLKQVRIDAAALEARVNSTEARAIESALHVKALLQSTSWQITAPIRWVGAPLNQLKTSLKARSTNGAMKRRLKKSLRTIALGIARYPTLQRSVSRGLDLLPHLKSRIATLLSPPPIAKQQVLVDIDGTAAERVPGAFTGKTVAVLTPTSATNETGGAERFYKGLISALRAQGCAVDHISLVVDESSFENIQIGYKAFAELPLDKYDLVISTKAPSYTAFHRNHILYLVHTVRVFYDMFDYVFPLADAALHAQREWIVQADTQAFGKIANRFSIGKEVSRRLAKWNGYDSTVLHPPMELTGFFNEKSAGYFFIPGRLHQWKRLDLLILAVKSSDLPMQLIIAGTGEAEHSLKLLADSDKRIQFVGRVDDAQLRELYAKALAVPFLPLREDYGYVTLEAFASGKAVITCEDSGEPTEFVKDGITGLICQPTTRSVREALELLWKDQELAEKMGRAGRESIASIQWPIVARKLLEAGFPPAKAFSLKVAVLDMQPILPAIGGGRLRLLGLYHNLGLNINVRYVGTYDWPGEAHRRHYITPTLEEIDVPLSQAHHEAAAEASKMAGGKVVIDMVFPQHAHLSPDYLAQVDEAVGWADVVVFAHPWVAPLVADSRLKGKTIVYDSQNVEKLLRAKILDLTIPFEQNILKGVEQSERLAGDRADLILACSAEDSEQFERVYGWGAGKLVTVPNGVFSTKIGTPSASRRRTVREELDLANDPIVAFFLGSNYQPNVEAATVILDYLAPRLPDVQFAIAGGVCTQLDSHLDNVKLVGILNDEQKLEWLHAADFAINPVSTGSGTNIKMFDYMAAALPVVTTPVGARGITTSTAHGILVVSNEDMPQTIRALVNNRSHLNELGEKNRLLVEANFSWEKISRLLGVRLKSTHLRVRGTSELLSNGSKLAVAHFGTIGIRCGIGEYARRLIESYNSHHVRNFVLTCDSAEETAPIPSSVDEVRVGWFYDNKDWTGSYIKPDSISALIEWNVDRIIIQYHPAYYSSDQLIAFVQQCVSHRIDVVVVLHKLPVEIIGSLRPLADIGTLFLCHSEREVLQAQLHGLDIALLPVGVDLLADCPRDIDIRDWGERPPLICTNGFLREHKNACRLIEAMPKILREFPGAKLIIQSALYPSDDSRRELVRCESLIEMLGLTDNVSLDTRFLEKRGVLSELSKCDLAVLPYGGSDEGGSASAADAIGLALPTITSSARVFDDIRGLVVTSPTDPDSLAQAIIAILNDPARYRTLSRSAFTYAVTNRWENIAGVFLAPLRKMAWQ